jgi:putative phage-type endonuclease
MIEQGTPEWYAQRLGKVTASRMADVVGKTKTGWGAGRANYAAQLIAERLTQTVAESYTSKEMQWGTDHEGEARDMYAFMLDAEVSLAGFVDHPKIAMAGASPDGMVGEDGLVEVKCPNTATHIDTLLGGGFPGKYHLQAKWQMACTGRQWCDLVSFDPRMPESMRLHVERVKRVDSEIAELEGAVRLFLQEVATKLEALTGLVKAA